MDGFKELLKKAFGPNVIITEIRYPQCNCIECDPNPSEIALKFVAQMWLCGPPGVHPTARELQGLELLKGMESLSDITTSSQEKGRLWKFG